MHPTRYQFGALSKRDDYDAGDDIYDDVEEGSVDNAYDDADNNEYVDKIMSIDDEDYDDVNGSGDYSYSTTSTTTTTTTTSTSTMTTTTTTTTARSTSTMPTDDEDLIAEGSGMAAEIGSGDGSPIEDDDDNNVDSHEGSGDYQVQPPPSVVTQLSPQEIDTKRRAFYHLHEADLFRLDTTCKTQFISAPQIFRAKIM